MDYSFFGSLLAGMASSHAAWPFSHIALYW
jgi:hypothetical protein